MAPRRSGRQRNTNALYKDHVSLDFLESDVDTSEDDRTETQATPRKRRPKSQDEDADFEIVRSDVVGPAQTRSDDDEDDNDNDNDDNEDGASFVSSLSDSDDSDDEASDGSDAFLKILSQGAILNPGQPRQRDSDASEEDSGEDLADEETGFDPQFYNRAVYHISKGHKRSRVLNYTNGQDAEEIDSLFRMMSRSAKNATIPSRYADVNNHGGLGPSPLVPDSQRDIDAKRAQWFSKLIQSNHFMNSQKLKSLSVTEERSYTPADRPLTILAVPNSNEKVQTLEAAAPIHLDAVWANRPGVDRNANRSYSKNGWLLNLSENVQCVGWMPSTGEDVQYLAVACRPEPSVAWDPEVQPKPPYTAFEPGEPGPSCIDVWKFETQRTSVDGIVTVSRDMPPMRLLSLCLNFGPLVEFKWCPMSMQSKKKGPFGLLATLHDDGALRIFALDLPRHSPGQQTQRLLLDRPSFETRPRQTVLSCIEWISPYLIAAGCADGHVAAWDIKAHYDAPSPPKSVRPLFYQPLHLAYVTMISPCTPSHPHLMTSASIDGSMRVTDLRDPQSNACEGTRARTPNGIAVWYEWMQCVLTIDEIPRARMNPLRHLETNIKLNRFDAAVAAMATSPLHGSLLTSTIDGVVAITCPANSWFRTKRHWHVLRQPWIKHQWRAGRAVPPADGHGRHGQSNLDFPGGLTRISTGHKVQDLREVYRQDNERERQRKKRKRQEKQGKQATEDDLGDSRASEIHDKKTATKTMAWNPNQCAGGWAAVGMGDGLVWVEDLSYE